MIRAARIEAAVIACGRRLDLDAREALRIEMATQIALDRVLVRADDIAQRADGARLGRHRVDGLRRIAGLEGEELKAEIFSIRVRPGSPQ